MILGKIINGFPYPAKNCSYCERDMQLQKAAHVLDNPEVFKALYYCLNDECQAYDEPARKCYALVYYSNNEALDKLYMQRIIMPERERRE